MGTNHHSFRRRRSAFTLIELLVVVAIIALLIAILLPSLGRARERAKITACLSNIHQLSVMYKLYMQDLNSKGLFWDHPTYDASIGYCNTEWMGGLRPYGLNNKLYYCPDATVGATTNNNVGGATTAWDGGNTSTAPKSYLIQSQTPAKTVYYQGSYGFNGWLMAYAGTDLANQKYAGSGSGMIFQPIANLPEGKIPVFGDGNFFVSWPHNNDSVPLTGGKFNPDGDIANGNAANKTPEGDVGSTPYIGRFTVDRHADHSVNWAFADNHAENVKLKKLWSFTWNKNDGLVANPAATITGWNTLP